MASSWPVGLFDSHVEERQHLSFADGPLRSQSSSPGPANAPRVLIVTQRFDPHADIVEGALTRMGASAVRLNSEDIHSFSFNWSSDPPGLQIGNTSAQPFDMNRIAGCYFRRPLPAPAHPDLKEPAAQIFSASETEAFLGGLYALPGLRWISPPAILQDAGAKISQLAVAKQVGFTVPRTVVSNDPATVLDFASGMDTEVVVKPLRTPFVEFDSSRIEFYAQRLSRSDVIRLAENARFAPTLLQEYVPKCSEVRVTVMGSSVFAVEITPVSPDLPLDWTSANASEFSYRPFPLPEKLERMIHEFLGRYRLQFGALDFLKTSDGNLVFLENNPNGVWYWLELETGLPMADSMARLLLGAASVE